MCKYYRRFCKNFSTVVLPLTKLLPKEVKFAWNSHCDDAFATIKTMVMNSPVLSTPDFDIFFVLYADASDSGVGGLLVQEKHGMLFF